jgi:hypothetical protein
MVVTIATSVCAVGFFVIGAELGWSAWSRWGFARHWLALVVSFLLAMVSFWVMTSAWLALFGTPEAPRFGIKANPLVIGLFWGLFLILLFRTIVSSAQHRQSAPVR